MPIAEANPPRPNARRKVMMTTESDSDLDKAQRSRQRFRQYTVSSRSQLMNIHPCIFLPVKPEKKSRFRKSIFSPVLKIRRKSKENGNEKKGSGAKENPCNGEVNNNLNPTERSILRFNIESKELLLDRTRQLNKEDNTGMSHTKLIFTLPRQNGNNTEEITTDIIGSNLSESESKEVREVVKNIVNTERRNAKESTNKTEKGDSDVDKIGSESLYDMGEWKCRGGETEDDLLEKQRNFEVKWQELETRLSFLENQQKHKAEAEVTFEKYLNFLQHSQDSHREKPPMSSFDNGAGNECLTKTPHKQMSRLSNYCRNFSDKVKCIWSKRKNITVKNSQGCIEMAKPTLQDIFRAVETSEMWKSQSSYSNNALGPEQAQDCSLRKTLSFASMTAKNRSVMIKGSTPSFIHMDALGSVIKPSMPNTTEVHSSKSSHKKNFSCNFYVNQSPQQNYGTIPVLFSELDTYNNSFVQVSVIHVQIENSGECLQSSDEFAFGIIKSSLE